MRAAVEIMPVIGFYLRTAVGGEGVFSYNYQDETLSDGQSEEAERVYKAYT